MMTSSHPIPASLPVTPAKPSSTLPLAYISGPISGVEKGAMIHSFFRGAREAESQGFKAVVPLEIKNWEDCGCKGSMAQGHHTWNCNLKKDIERLIRCDAIFMLPGWSFSRGATLELHIASELALKCVYLEW